MLLFFFLTINNRSCLVYASHTKNLRTPNSETLFHTAKDRKEYSIEGKRRTNEKNNNFNQKQQEEGKILVTKNKINEKKRKKAATEPKRENENEAIQKKMTQVCIFSSIFISFHLSFLSRFSRIYIYNKYAGITFFFFS